MPRRFGVERFTAVREGLRAAGESLSEIKFVNPGRPSSLSWGTMPGERYLDQLRPQAKGRRHPAGGGDGHRSGDLLHLLAHQPGHPAL